MAWAHVQSTTNYVASGANAKAFASAVAAGSLLVIDVTLETDTATVSSLVSSTGNTCTAVGALTSLAGLGAQRTYYVKNATAGATTITLTPSAGGCHLSIHEYSGLDTSAPFDVAAAASGSSTSADSGPASTAGANELIHGATMANRAITLGAGFTERINTSFNIFIETEDKNGSGGSQNATATIATSGQVWITTVTAFKEPAGSGAARHTLSLLGVG